MGVLGALSAQSGALLARGVFALSTGLTFPFTKSGVLIVCAAVFLCIHPGASDACQYRSHACPLSWHISFRGQTNHLPFGHGLKAELDCEASTTAVERPSLLL